MPSHAHTKSLPGKSLEESPAKQSPEGLPIASSPQGEDMVALVLDASNHFLVAGIFGRGLALEHVEFAPRSAFQRLHEILRDLLEKFKEQSGLEKPDWIGATIGPGSFTGLRISAGTARNLSQLWGIPVLGTDSLSFMARVFVESLAGTQPPERLAVLLDGRQRQVYWSCFDLPLLGKADLSSPKIRIRDTSPALALDLLEEHSGTMLLCVDDPSRVASYLSEGKRQLWQNFLEKNRICKWPLPSARILYRHLCAIGGKAKAGGWHDLLPIYVRSDPATSKYPGGFSHALGSQ